MKTKRKRMTSSKTSGDKEAPKPRVERLQSLSMRRKRKKRTSMRTKMAERKMVKRKMRSFRRSGESMCSQKLTLISASPRSFAPSGK